MRHHASWNQRGGIILRFPKSDGRVSRTRCENIRCGRPCARIYLERERRRFNYRSRVTLQNLTFRRRNFFWFNFDFNFHFVRVPYELRYSSYKTRILLRMRTLMWIDKGERSIAVHFGFILPIFTPDMIPTSRTCDSNSMYCRAFCKKVIRAPGGTNSSKTRVSAILLSYANANAECSKPANHIGKMAHTWFL